jgi:hypothetical protein
MRLILSLSLAGALTGAVTNIQADTNAIAIQINKAVQLNWPGVDGALYQVYSSSNLTQWTPSGAPLVGIDGVSNSVVYPTSSPGVSFFRVDKLPTQATNRFIRLTNVEWGAASVILGPNTMSLSNLRLQSAQFSINDYVTANFWFDMSRQVFQITHYSVAPGVGVYNDTLFANSNTNPVYLFQTTNNLLNAGTKYSITASNSPYYMDLTVGHAVSFRLGNPTVSYRFEFIDPNGNVLDSGIFTTNVITGIEPILTSGRYVVKFIPFNTAAKTVSLDVTFLNANARPLARMTNGSALNLTFATSLRDYAKYQLTLDTNQLLSLPKPADSNIRFTMLNSSSVTLVDQTGLPLTFQPSKADTYYLFIYNQNGWGSSYSGTASITTISGLGGSYLPAVKRSTAASDIVR